MIRTAEQAPAIEKLGHNQLGKLSVLVSSVADVKSEADAQGILDRVKPDWVVWSAGTYARITSLYHTHVFSYVDSY
jgi:hypothetical protein